MLMINPPCQTEGEGSREPEEGHLHQLVPREGSPLPPSQGVTGKASLCSQPPRRGPPLTPGPNLGVQIRRCKVLARVLELSGVAACGQVPGRLGGERNALPETDAARSPYPTPGNPKGGAHRSGLTSTPTARLQGSGLSGLTPPSHELLPSPRCPPGQGWLSH